MDAPGDGGERVPLRAMARTLGQLGPPGVDALARLTAHSTPLVRGIALDNLAKRDPARARPSIARSLRDPDPRVRRTAAACRERLGVRAGVGHG